MPQTAHPAALGPNHVPSHSPPGGGCAVAQGGSRTVCPTARHPKASRKQQQALRSTVLVLAHGPRGRGCILAQGLHGPAYRQPLCTLQPNCTYSSVFWYPALVRRMVPQGGGAHRVLCPRCAKSMPFWTQFPPVAKVTAVTVVFPDAGLLGFFPPPPRPLQSPPPTRETVTWPKKHRKH